MSTFFNRNNELRYMKRNQLEEEAKVVGNYYRDIIRSYGLDINYYKLNTDVFANYRGIVDQNILMKHAYGYNISPDYSVSAHMLSYMEVEQDIFQANRFGVNSNTDVNFYFDSKDFACDLATKLGQYKEYKIKETEINIEVPEIDCRWHEIVDPVTHEVVGKTYLSASTFPYQLGVGNPEQYYCECLKGKLATEIKNYQFGKEQTVVCHPYEHTKFIKTFSSNPDLYKAFQHQFQNDDYLDTMLYLKFKVNKVIDGIEDTYLKVIDDIQNISDIKCQIKNCYEFIGNQPQNNWKDIDFTKELSLHKLITIVHKLEKHFHLQPTQFDKTQYEKCVSDLQIAIEHITDICKQLGTVQCIKKRCVLSGKLFGSVLFYDLSQVGKYIDMIHPEVGDIITIDFPDENNREQYEITDAFDKSLQSDGISPLLHKYIWKCKARRYVNNYEEIENNEANERLEEKHKFDQAVAGDVTEKISFYNDKDDAAYGGYSNVIEEYDKMKPNPNTHEKYEYIEDGTAIDIMKFACGSKLVTTGYDLLFIQSNGDAFKLIASQIELPLHDAYVESGLKYLKANSSSVVFTNILGESFQLAFDDEIANQYFNMQLDSLQEKTLDVTEINSVNDNFYKFRNCRTILFATETNLFCRLESNKKIYQLI